MRIIGRFWKHYRACLQALKKGIIGKKKKNYLSGPTIESNSYGYKIFHTKGSEISDLRLAWIQTIQDSYV